MSSSIHRFGFVAALDWLLAGQAGEFGQKLAALAIECDNHQLEHLLNAFKHEFERAEALAELYDWAGIPFEKPIGSAAFIATNKLQMCESLPRIETLSHIGVSNGIHARHSLPAHHSV